MKKITFITTVNHNVGDDFVREGLKFLLRKYFKNEVLEFENIHKHSPITSRYGFEWFRYYRLSSIVDRVLPLSFTKDRVLQADLLVQSGAPVYWCHNRVGSHCSENEWYGPLIRRRLANNFKAKLLNLAAGTCQEYHSDGSEFLRCTKDIQYIKQFYNLSTVNTVRDTLARSVLNSMGLDAPLIPCSSIFAIDEYGMEPESGAYVAINYMNLGGHYDLGGNVDSLMWKSEFKKFYDDVSRHEKLIFVCHDKRELQAAKTIDANAEVFYSSDYLDYMKFYAKAKFGIVNRVHGAFMMASFGKPSIVIGSDSRAKMASEIGIENIFVNDASFEYLKSKFLYLGSGADNYSEKFYSLKAQAYTDYMKALSVL